MSADKGKPMGFNVVLGEKDFISFNLLGIGFVFLWFVGYIAVVIAFLSFSGFYKNLTPEGFVRYIWIPAGVMVGLCAGYYYYIRWQAVRFFKKAPDITAEVGYQVLDKGLSIRRGKEQKILKWDSFYRVAANRDVVAFFTSKSNAYIVPVAVLEEAEALEKLFQVVCREVPKKRLRLPRRWKIAN